MYNSFDNNIFDSIEWLLKVVKQNSDPMEIAWSSSLAASSSGPFVGGSQNNLYEGLLYLKSPLLADWHIQTIGVHHI